MNYYVDIQTLPNSDFSNHILMNILFSHLHKLLVEFSKGEVGISFPHVSKTLGTTLRLHGHQSSLQPLMCISEIKGLRDYIKVSVISQIPEKVSYRVVKRLQTKSSKERLYRRSLQKGWINKEEAVRKISDNSKKISSLPFLKIKSHSTNQAFLLFIEHGPILSDPVPGKFTSYGLSSCATVPWF